MDRKQYGQDRAPIAEAMKAYAGDGALAFHTPGHKQGLGAHALLRELITAQGLREEVSLMEELDNLHAPSGCIREAQELAAELYGADAAYFMVNGTTGAVHTMLLAALSPGDTVLVPRNAHRSMMGGILLSGARPVFLSPEIDGEWGIPMGLSVETVREAVEQHPDAKALALVSPTYYGVASDLREMAKILHEKGMLLLVDEAHGAHLKFHAGLPPQAMDAGADLAAQSTHKLLGSLTQSSMLLGRKGRVDFSRVQEAASLLQSTSPNYLLLASLDIARMQMAMEGRERIARAVRLSEGLREAVRGLDGLESFGQEIVGNPGVCGLDATKVTISVRGLGLTGMEAERILRYQYKVQCELSDPYNLLFILSMADTETELASLVGALQGLARDHRGKETFSVSMELPEIPEQRMLPREAFFADKERVALERAAGRVSAEQVVFYPPGIPVLCPGELVSRELIAYIRRMQGLGRRIVGAEDAELRTLRVIR